MPHREGNAMNQKTLLETSDDVTMRGPPVRARIVLFVHWDRGTADQQRCFQPAVPSNNQARALRDGDRIAPAFFLDDRRKKLDLMGAVSIRVDRFRFQRVWIDEGCVGVMHGNAHALCP